MANNVPDTYSDPVHIAIIGGTGLQALPNLTHAATLTPSTPWGPPSSPIHILHHTPKSTTSSTSTPATHTPVAFLARHGPSHALAPHEIPNRANIAALRHIGVRVIVAFSAVGSLREEIKPRDFVVPDQVVDRTKGVTPFTFFEGGVVAHVGFADPFDEKLRAVVNDVATNHGVGADSDLHTNGTLICMEGPQFSTRAESNLYRTWGGSVINMSCLPEAKLAREAEIAYSMICMATDYDCWRNQSGEDVSVEMVMKNMSSNAENARTLVGNVLDELAEGRHGALVRGEHLMGNTTGFAAGVTAKEGRGGEAVERLEWLFPGCF